MQARAAQQPDHGHDRDRPAARRADLRRVITETIFGIAGFGALTVDAVNQRDYTLIQGVVLVAAAGYVSSTLRVDVVYSLLNPRIRVVRGRGMSVVDVATVRSRTRARRRRMLLRKRFLRRPIAVAGLVVGCWSSWSPRSSRRCSHRIGAGATDFNATLAHPFVEAPARDRRARPRRALAAHLGSTRVDPGRVLRDGARDGGRRADRPRRGLLPRLGRHGDRAASPTCCSRSRSSSSRSGSRRSSARRSRTRRSRSASARCPA